MFIAITLTYIRFFYFRLLQATGVLGYYLGGDKALHGAVAGGAGDAAMTLMGVMAASENKMVMMIGVRRVLHHRDCIFLLSSAHARSALSCQPYEY